MPGFVLTQIMVKNKKVAVRGSANAEQAKLADVVLIFGDEQDWEMELVRGVELKEDPTSRLLLQHVLNQLKLKGFDIHFSHVSYRSEISGLDVECGYDPLFPNFSIPGEALGTGPAGGNQLILVCRRVSTMKHGTSLLLASGKKHYEVVQDDMPELKSSKRTKERKIGFIIGKVKAWRQLYQDKHLSLDESAEKVGISKKSLDDYLLQMRYGTYFGFNFQAHKEDKVGLLRAYVKEFKLYYNALSKSNFFQAVDESRIQSIIEAVHKGPRSCCVCKPEQLQQKYTFS